MADISEVVIHIDAELVQKIKQLLEYKSIADEALSAINEVEFTDPWMLHIQELALRAANKGAQIL